MKKHIKTKQKRKIYGLIGKKKRNQRIMVLAREEERGEDYGLVRNEK